MTKLTNQHTLHPVVEVPEVEYRAFDAVTETGVLQLVIVRSHSVGQSVLDKTRHACITICWDEHDAGTCLEWRLP